MKLNDYEAIPDKYTGIIDRPSGITWYVEGKLHRTDGPALEWANGNREWWVVKVSFIVLMVLPWNGLAVGHGGGLLVSL